MKDKDILDEISSIKNIMERSTRFISLSGLSGVMAGIYALVGAGLAYNNLKPFYEITHNPNTGFVYGESSTLSNIKGLFYGSTNTGYLEAIAIQLLLIAIIVLILSIGTGILLTIRKAHRKSQSVWNQSSRAFLKKGLLPLLTGGCFILILLAHQYYSIIAPACLIFYGLALAAASQYTYGDVKWLGLSEIGLGLLAMLFPLYGLLFWALGFGVLHILYGTVMYFKYDRENSAH